MHNHQYNNMFTIIQQTLTNQSENVSLIFAESEM
jgi:hypothetical protein